MTADLRDHLTRGGRRPFLEIQIEQLEPSTCCLGTIDHDLASRHWKYRATLLRWRKLLSQGLATAENLDHSYLASAVELTRLPCYGSGGHYGGPSCDAGYLGVLCGVLAREGVLAEGTWRVLGRLSASICE